MTDDERLMMAKMCGVIEQLAQDVSSLLKHAYYPEDDDHRYDQNIRAYLDDIWLFRYNTITRPELEASDDSE